MRRFQGTLSLLTLSVLIQILLSYCPELIEAFAFNAATPIGWLALLPHMVAHAGWAHLVGNFCWGLPFCLYLEWKLGKKRFLEFYVLCGIGGGLLHSLINGGSLIGSSGALFGVMGGACAHWGKTWPEHVLAMSLFSCHFINNLIMAPLGALLGIGFYGHLGGGLTALLLSLRFYAPQYTNMPRLPRQAKERSFRFSSMGKRLKKHASRCARLVRL